MKRRILMSCLTAFCIAATSASMAYAKKYTFTFATNAPENTMRGVAEKQFIEELESLSDGKIKVVPYWAESLVKGKEILKSVQDGVVDFGFININYYPNRLLLNGATGMLEEGPTQYENMIGVYEDIYATIPELNEEFLKYKQRPVYIYSALPYSFSSREPISSFKDLKGMKARSSSRWKLADLGSIGAVPTSVAFSECYMSLQTGVIDTVLTNVDAQSRAKLYEVAPNIMVAPQMWLALPFMITMNEKKYQALPDELKQVVAQARENAVQRFTEYYPQTLEDEIKGMEAKGAKFTYASAEDMKAWMSLPTIEENLNTWSKEVTALGAKSPEKILETVFEINNGYLAKEQ
ncbi:MULTISPECIES: TRAP transporter substrate-binding protein [Desulfosediminicola]|uniref:TRAP transporter substrate-binding protein n=1 Tax=Desulfosediminicola TaxID=2886823 RepID=UPI0010AC354D|nr:TRAP transporter substrate-binding protein DctP [Desulfosediminicola ganghwensis]